MTVFANCPSDGIWSSIAGGQTRAKDCEGDTWGEMYRTCSAATPNVWGDIDTQHCLPLYPPEGTGYVDFYFLISNSRAETIKRTPIGVVQAIAQVYRVNENEVSVHYVGENPSAPDV